MKKLLFFLAILLIATSSANAYSYLHYLTVENVSINPTSPIPYDSPFTINNQVMKFDENDGTVYSLVSNGSFETGNLNNFQPGKLTVLGGCTTQLTYSAINETSPNGIYNFKATLNLSTGDDRCIIFLEIPNEKIYAGDTICYYGKLDPGAGSTDADFVLINDANLGANVCPDGSNQSSNNCTLTTSGFIEKCNIITNGGLSPGYDGNTLRFGLQLRTTNGATNAHLDYIRIKRKTLNQEITTDANCYSTVGLLPIKKMSVSGNDFYSDNNALNYSATTNYGIACTKSGYTLDDYNSSFQTYRSALDFLKFTPIENIASYVLGSVVIYPQNEGSDIIFKVDSNSAFSEDVNYLIYNSLTNGKRYFVYTASASDYASGIWNFNNSLTFGTTAYNGIQTVWDSSLQNFKHSFFDTLNFGETKYYLLKYQAPLKSWISLNTTSQSDWDVSFPPSILNVNNHSKDFFQVSTYNNIRNQYRTKLPAITSDVSNLFYLAFNARSDNASTTLNVGKNLNGTDSTSSINVSSIETTLHVSTGADYPLMQSSSTTSKTIELSDYALIEKGFFTKTLEVKKIDGSDLDVQLVKGDSVKVIKEGRQFKVQSQVYNKNNSLSYIEGKIYFYGTNDNNQVAYFKKDLNALGVNEPYNIDWTIDGVLDLNGISTRPLIVLLKAVDDLNHYYEIQSETLTFEQFPSSNSDIYLSLQTVNKQVGSHPKIYITLKDYAPETLRGIKIYIYDIDRNIYSAEYSKTFWKGTDFTCTGFDCSFTKEIDDYAYEYDGFWNITTNVLLTTMNENTNNYFASKTISYLVSFKEFETARILETYERNLTHTYNDQETIPLVLQLRDNDFSNLKNDLSVYLIASNCGADENAGTCTDIDVNYFPSSFIYDASTGYNYFFWNELFHTTDNMFLTNGTYYRFKAVILDSKEQHLSTTLSPLLTTKCQAYDTDCSDGFCFFTNMLASLNHFLFGCNTSQSSVVTTDSNSNEHRLLISSSYSPNAPSFEGFLCLNTDQNNIYVDQLKQDLTCVAFYKLSERQIDQFSFYITNKYSDLSKIGSSAQYVKVEVPFSVIATNDLSLMKQSLALNYGTAPDTVGELVFQGFNKLFTGVANPIANFSAITFFNSSGIIKNVGFDINFSRALDPTYVGGFIFFKIKGLKVINQQDYLTDYPDLKGINPSDFAEYTTYKNYAIPYENMQLEFYTTDFQKAQANDTISRLIIDEPYSEQSINQQNTNGNEKTQTLPAQLTFYIISDLVYDSEQSYIRRYVPIIITAVIAPEHVNITAGIQEFFKDLAKNPGKWAVKNWFLILLGVIAVLIFGLVYGRIKGTGGNTTVIYANQAPQR